MKTKISIAVLGSTGYVGLELVYLLSKREDISINFLGSENSANKKINLIDSRIKKNLPDIKLNSQFKEKNIEILFLALPHKVSQNYVKKFHNKLKIIDLSADFRLDNESVYNQNYNQKHSCPELLKEFVYGLFEINFNLIKNSNNIAIPGCYPTSVLLPLIPLLKFKIIKSSNIIIDSKSGYSGAGKNFDKSNIFKSKIDLNFYNYNTNQHRHICEIKQELQKFTDEDVLFSFNPHILPIYRGMMSTIYCDLTKKFSIEEINQILKQFYKEQQNIEIIEDDTRGDFNQIQHTNKCIIKLFKHYTSSKIILVSLIDNLQKGAAGQAIQCMSAMLNN